MKDCLTIGRLAGLIDVNVETIRYYQRRGLMPVPDRPAGGVRRYGSEDVARLRFIRQAQGLGFSLDEVASLLRLRDGGDACGDVQSLTESRLALLRDKMRQIQSMEHELTALLSACRSGQPPGGAPEDCCPLLESLWPTDTGDKDSG